MAIAEVSRQRRYQLEYPERHKARSAVQWAVKTGKLPRPSTLPCADCGGAAQAYHHHNGYEREHWLDVQPLCDPCHGQRHAGWGEPPKPALDWADTPPRERMTADIYSEHFKHYGETGMDRFIHNLEQPPGCAAAFVQWTPIGRFYAPCQSRATGPGGRYCTPHEKQRAKKQPRPDGAGA